ncbi:Hypothetical protein I595_3378 [Croceitalea dokdonensis DOKDO 023]|uniref:DUF4861 domain-containing protein n=1 Tax=Croceitalea dokdonensis DOKDO 023 TaxID=1300341 RepID=A0A0P7ARW2_9FLAO|nr:DUF4861 family protein [Croceitalea dokdonensis]KPM30557.1 Hypothetical protein I595_3378 [Croceitalea dokdonensis DOKDO 023]
MKSFLTLPVLFLALFAISCQEKAARQQIVVENTMDAHRAFETVSVNLTTIKNDGVSGAIIVKDAKTGEVMTSQEVDTDGDGTVDVLLFQPKIAANATKTYEVHFGAAETGTKGDPSCYSRFVPERTDDYAWENNRVAFRTYGPTAQKMVEDSVKGGTLSSGMDAWLKRVDYPIINKWYKKELETDGSYHKDDGEGLDNFHVGISRGVGGIAKKVDSIYHISKNFTSWKTLSTGPIRTSFILTYADWDAAGNMISEEKKISLDYGQNLSRFEITLKGTDTISAGLTLHEKDGDIGVNQDSGWVSYWELHGDSELGTGIVVPNGNMLGYEHYLTERKDESNLYAHIKTNDGKAVYYAGFGWKKSGQFSTKAQWEAYLDRFAQQLQNPLQVTIK